MTGGDGFCVVDREKAVDADLDVVAAHREGEAEPFFIIGKLLGDVAHGVERACALLFAIGALAECSVVDLDFEAFFGGAGILEGCVEVDAGIAAGAGEHFGFEFEILEGTLCVEKMRYGARGSKKAFPDCPRSGIRVRLPTLEGLAVEEIEPTRRGLGGKGGGGCKERATVHHASTVY